MIGERLRLYQHLAVLALSPLLHLHVPLLPPAPVDLLHNVILDREGPNDLAQLRAETLITQDLPLLATPLLPAVGPARQQIPLPRSAVQVGRPLQVLRQKGVFQKDSLQLPVQTGGTVLPLPGPGWQLPEGRFPGPQVGLPLPP